MKPKRATTSRFPDAFDASLRVAFDSRLVGNVDGIDLNKVYRSVGTISKF